MRLRQVLDELLEILEAEEEGKHFNSLGALRKSKFQHDKGEDDAFLRHDMYAGTIGNSEAAKRGAETRKKNGTHKIAIEKGRKTRADWYKNPENKKKFEASIAARDKRNKKKKEQSNMTTPSADNEN